MQFKSIILSLAASVALVRAAAIPAPEPQHNMCIERYSMFFEALMLSPVVTPVIFTEAGECSVCLTGAAGKAAPEYFLGDFDGAKETFDDEMAKCPTAGNDRTYDTCVEEYSEFFEDLFGVSPANIEVLTASISAGECSVCLFLAIENNYKAYIDGEFDTAKNGFDENMETCNE